MMLLRNIDQIVGLCNGTWLIITKMDKYVIEGTILSWRNIGNKIYLPQLLLPLSNSKVSFKFQRRWFPLVLSFVMTINKSQEQSLKRVEVYLPQFIYSHIHLYVAFSRVALRNGRKIMIVDHQNQQTNITSNIIYKEIFQNLK